MKSGPTEIRDVAPVRSEVAVRCDAVSVSFGGTRALSDVAISFPAGRIHALAGQNGAGKTTLARVFAGVIAPDSGQVFVGASETTGGGVSLARSRGVEMVHQHLALPPSATAVEALELFSRAPRRGFYRRRALIRDWQDRLDRLGVSIPPTARVRDLSLEAAQALEIIRALSADAKLLILDEPTAALAPDAVERLFDRVRAIRDQGVTVIIVLHKLQEVRAVAETVSVLRGGRTQLHAAPIDCVSDGELAELLIGERATEVAVRSAAAPTAPAFGPRLRLDRLSTVATQRDQALRAVTLSVAPGEIVGVAGVEGNGQRPLVAAVCGISPITGGRAYLGGTDITHAAPATRRGLGLRIVPFDRNVEGLSQSSPLWWNIGVLPVLLRQLTRGPFLRLRALRAHARTHLDRWHVVYRSVEQPARELSGGNAQRAVLARELWGDVEVLVAAQPTRGLDLGATEFVHRTLNDLADAGAAVVLVSSDLDELLDLSTRIVVMLGGAIVAEFTPPFELKQVGAAMVGAPA